MLGVIYSDGVKIWSKPHIYMKCGAWLRRLGFVVGAGRSISTAYDDFMKRSLW